MLPYLNRIIGFILLFILSSYFPAYSQAISVAPVRFELSTKNNSAVLTVTNQDTVPMELQIRPMQWTQVNGEDIYNAADSIAISPPRFTLEPGKQQLVRLFIDNKNNLSSEQSYRVIIDQLPNLDTNAGQVSMQVRFVLPVFFAPAHPVEPNLIWQAHVLPDVIELKVKNIGTQHARIHAINIDQNIIKQLGLDQENIKKMLLYILPNSEQIIRIPYSKAVDNTLKTLDLDIESNIGNLAVSVNVF